MLDAKDQLDPLPNGDPAKNLVLFGNAGSSIWSKFSQSEEFVDGQQDPLNRWSERVAEKLARKWQGIALFPFGGPPYQPFLKWAKRSENLHSSKLGMLIHPRYGLWHAYRFAIALGEITGPQFVESVESDHPCDSCLNQPCLSGCPVDAFDGERYDVEACFQYLKSHSEAPCHRFGCQARVACPQGQNFLYEPEHAGISYGKVLPITCRSVYPREKLTSTKAIFAAKLAWHLHPLH